MVTILTLRLSTMTLKIPSGYCSRRLTIFTLHLSGYLLAGSTEYVTFCYCMIVC